MAAFAKVHKVGFVQVEPKAIHCLAYDEDVRKIAVSRSDNSIEIWNLQGNPYQECTFLARLDYSVEALGWYQGRLFSTGLSGFLVEYCPYSFEIKEEQPVTSGAGWCLSIHRDSGLLAVGTENGYVSIFTLLEDGFTYEKHLDRQQGRILSIAWHPGGKFLVTGSIDFICIWNVAAGHSVTRITTGRSQPNSECIVWCVAFCSDFTIITGDSRGKTCFWDGHMGTLKTSFRSHRADVLCLSLSPTEDSVYTSGVDPMMVEFKRAEGGEREWVRSLGRVTHSHDVRAVLNLNKFLITGGIDGYLSISTRHTMTVRYPGIPQAPCVEVLPTARKLLVHTKTALELWRLGSAVDREPPKDGSRRFLKVIEPPRKVLVIEPQDNEIIITCAASPNASWLAYSLTNSMKIFNLELVREYEEDIVLRKVKCLPSECERGATALSFISEDRLLAGDNQGSLHVFRFHDMSYISGPQCDVSIPNVLTGEVGRKSAVCLISHDSKEKRCAVAGSFPAVAVVDLNSFTVTHRLKVNSLAPVTAMAMQPGTSNLILVFSDRMIQEVNAKTGEFTKWYREIYRKLPLAHLSHPYAARGVSFHPRHQNLLLIHDTSAVVILDKQQIQIENRDTKKELEELKRKSHKRTKKMGRKEESHKEAGVAVHKQYRHVVGMGFLSEDELVIVQRTPEQLISTLPPPLKKKKFGT